MWELLSGGVVGSLIGGLLRLAPEILKWRDKKDERAHELAMFSQQVELEKTRGSIRMDEIGAQSKADIDLGTMAAFKSAIESQADMLKGAHKWVKSASAAVRPVITYWLWVVYSLAVALTVYVAVQEGMKALEITKMILTPDFMALLSGTTNYWFLDRTLSKRGLM